MSRFKYLPASVSPPCSHALIYGALFTSMWFCSSLFTDSSAASGPTPKKSCSCTTIIVGGSFRQVTMIVTFRRVLCQHFDDESLEVIRYHSRSEHRASQLPRHSRWFSPLGGPICIGSFVSAWTTALVTSQLLGLVSSSHRSCHTQCQSHKLQQWRSSKDVNTYSSCHLRSHELDNCLRNGPSVSQAHRSHASSYLRKLSLSSHQLQKQ